MSFYLGSSFFSYSEELSPSPSKLSKILLERKMFSSYPSLMSWCGSCWTLSSKDSTNFSILEKTKYSNFATNRPVQFFSFFLGWCRRLCGKRSKIINFENQWVIGQSSLSFSQVTSYANSDPSWEYLTTSGILVGMVLGILLPCQKING